MSKISRRLNNFELLGTDSSRRVLIVAGGTGGHIIPALAVGEALRTRFAGEVVVRYLSGSRPVESQAFAAAEEFPDSLACDSAPRLSLTGIPSLLRYAGSIGEAWSYLRRYRPHAILATGGYVCAPVLWAARMLRIPVFMHESNAVAGRVTRMFGPRAERVFLGHEAAKAHLGKSTRTEVVGTPVRREVFEACRDAALSRFGLDPSVPTMVVLGGSQGALALNDAMLSALPHLVGERLQVIWACGPLNLKSVSSQLASLNAPNLTVSLHDYLQEMPLAYAAASLVVSRAGASTLAEISAGGIPSVLVPLPSAKDNHQYENARTLSERGAALLLEEKNLSGRALAEAITGIIGSPETREAMANACDSAGYRECADRIADAIMTHVGAASGSKVKFRPNSKPAPLGG